MNLLRFASPSLAILGSMALSVSAEVGWTKTGGPGGGDIEALVADGDRLYAGTGTGFDGVFLSMNRGSSWTAINSGLSIPWIQGLAKLGSDLYAGTENGLFRSADSGKTWIDKSAGIASKEIRGLAAIGSELFLGTTKGGIYVTRDRGDTWVDLSAGIDKTSMVTSAVKLDSVLVVGTSKGPYLSRDRGTSWQAFTLGETTGSVIRSAASSGTALYLGTSMQGIFRSTDTGKTWSSVSNGLPDSCINVLFDSDRGLFAGTWIGLYRSVDGGDHWLSIGQNLPSSTAVRSVAVQGADLFAGTEADGVFRSPDTGKTWVAANKELTAITGPHFHATDSNLFARTIGGGVFRSDLIASDWKAVNKGLIGYSSIAALWNTGERLLLSANYGIYGSDDNGGHWIRTAGDTSGIIAFAGRGADLYAWQNGGNLLASGDSGRSWTIRTANVTSKRLTCLLEQGTRLFAGTANGGLLFSPDSGKTWTASLVASNIVYALTNIGDRMFLAAKDGIHRSEGADTWTRVRPDPVDTTFQHIAASGTRLFAITYRHVFASDDLGTTWDVLGTSVPGSQFLDLAVAGKNLVVLAGKDLWFTPLDASSAGVAPRSKAASNSVMNFGGRACGSGIRFSFELAQPGKVTLRLHDLSGRELATLIDAPLASGVHEEIWLGARKHGPVIATLRVGHRIEQIRLAPRW